MNLKSGALVGHHYIVESLLGIGGMASVYRVRHRVLNKLCALKVLHPHLLHSAEARHRFLEEGRLQATLNHPGIAPVLEVISEPGLAGLILELLIGEDLESRLQSVGTMPFESIRRLMDTVLETLAWIHQRGVVHRDLKSANLFLERLPSGEERLRLMDFGIALSPDRRLTRAGTMMGTLEYTAPEQLRAPETVDARADLFSAGVLAYELLFGQTPFHADSDLEIQQRIVEGIYIAASERDPTLSIELDAWLDSSLSVDRKDRFVSADAMRAALTALNPHAPPPAQDPSSLPAGRAIFRNGRLQLEGATARATARLDKIRSDLIDLELDDGASGLPEHIAAIAVGDEPLLPLPEETLEDLRQLGREARLPSLRAPNLHLRAQGNLTATAAERFAIHVTLTDPDTGVPAQRQGARWISDNSEGLLPVQLADALDRISKGTPTGSSGESPAAITRQRMLWWGRLRRILLEHDAQLGGYLARNDATIVDRLKPRLSRRPDGSMELLLGADNVDTNALTQAIDRFNPRANQDPTLNWRDSNGSTHRQRLLFTETARRAATAAQRLRRSPHQALPRLLEAPETLLDPSLFDLSSYGDRVVGFGPVVYRVSRDQRSDGTPTLSLEPSAGEGSADPLGSLTDEQQRELAEKLHQAAQRGIPYLHFQGAWIRVPAPKT
ncbi:MAG: serine/threonine protein kinase, partial [Myxococcota bacterium]